MNSEYIKSEVPSFDTMFKPILRALKALGNTANIDALDMKAIEYMNLSPEVQKLPHGTEGNRTELEYHLAWARTYLKKYGLIENPKRGVWTFTDAFDGDIDSINEKLIVQAVRQWNLEAFQTADLSNIESASAFKRFALSGLRDHMNLCGKSILFHSNEKAQYDAVLPQGIEEDNKRTYVEIKYAKNKFSYKSILPKSIKELKENEQLLLILGSVLSQEEKLEIKELAQSCSKCNVIVWDYNDLFEKIRYEPDYVGYLVNPQKALVEDAISSSSDPDKQKEVRKERIELLKEAYRCQNVTLFLGAGVSMDAGIPLWNKLVHKLLIAMIQQKTEGVELNPQEIETLNELVNANREDTPLTQIRYIRSAFENEEYHEIVRNVLYQDKINTNTDLLNALSEIVKPERAHVGVKSIVTYNFDDLLERKLFSKNINFNVVCQETDMPSTNSLNIYHVHGFLPHNTTEKLASEISLIFSEEDYHRVYRDAYCWSNITQLNAFRDSTCLFIGCSLSDPNLRRLLDIPARVSESPRHFAIMKRKSIQYPPTLQESDKKLIKLYQNIDNNVREELFRTLGINVIWIDDYKEIPKILLELPRN